MTRAATPFYFMQPQLTPGLRRVSRRRWLDSLMPACPRGDCLVLGCSTRSASFAFRLTEALRESMLLLNVRTREIVKVLKRPICYDPPNHRYLYALVSVERDYVGRRKGGFDPQSVKEGDEWILLGLEEHATSPGDPFTFHAIP